jgi:integrase/recombinase XerD
MVSHYINDLKKLKPLGNKVFVETHTPASKPTKKLHLTAIRKLFDKLVEYHAIALNPASAVHGPRYSQTEGKTPAFASPQQARELLDSIDTSCVVGLRDRAMLGTFTFTGVRASAVSKLRCKDYYSDGTQYLMNFDEKGGKARTIPVRHELQIFVDEYIAAAGLAGVNDETPLFRTIGQKTKVLTDKAMKQPDILRMVKRRLVGAGLPAQHLTTHSFRATVITDLLKQDVPVADVQYLAGHADPRTTLLYDRRKREVSRNIVERISV